MTHLNNTELFAEFQRTADRYARTDDLAQRDILWQRLEAMQHVIAQRTEVHVFLAHGLITEEDA